MEKIKIVNIYDKITLYSLYTIAFFFPISKAIIEIFSTLAIICYILKKIAQKEDVPRTRLSLAVFIYLIICFLSIFISSNFKIGARTFLGKTIQQVLFFFTVAETLNSERRMNKFLYILLCSSLLLGIDGIYQHFTHKEFIRNREDFGIPRISATFPSPSDFGCYLVAVIPFVLVNFFLKFRFKVFRFLFVCLFMLLFSCLVLTVSRGAWFAFIASMLFMSIWVRWVAVFLLMLGIIIICLQQFFDPFIRGRLNNFFIFLDNSGIERNSMWSAAWKMFISRPWLGVGLGTFMFNFKKFVEAGFPYIAYAHNCYLQMLSEMGIIGLMSFLSILVLFFSRGIEMAMVRQRTASWYMLLASLAAVLAYSVQMVVDTIFYSLDLGILFWMLLGLGTAAMKNVKLESNKPMQKENLLCPS